jgi:hypothetical protein
LGRDAILRGHRSALDESHSPPPGFEACAFIMLINLCHVFPPSLLRALWRREPMRVPHRRRSQVGVRDPRGQRASSGTAGRRDGLPARRNPANGRNVWIRVYFIGHTTEDASPTMAGDPGGARPLVPLSHYSAVDPSGLGAGARARTRPPRIRHPTPSRRRCRAGDRGLFAS